MNTLLDTKKMSVEEIRQLLITEHGIAADVVNDMKGKNNLVNFMNSLNKVETTNGTTTKDDFGFEFKEPVQENNQSEHTVIDVTDPGWTEYALGQLTDNEKQDNYPKADGLRRLVEKLICPIVGTEVDVVQAPSIENNMVSTVKVKVLLDNKQSYAACADTQYQKCIEPYNQFLSAISETRAKGRVYREILRLQNICSAEEVMSSGEGFSNEKINATQKSFISAMCDTSRMNINVIKLFNSVFKDKAKSNVSDYSLEQGTEVSRILSEYQQDITKIPSDILGYDPGWKN